MMNSNADTIVLISGINGYIASHIGLLLLQKGYTVRGTSRSIGARDRLVSDAFKGYESQYQHYEVKDITVPGAFDEAVKGVHSIIHTASPVDFTLTSFDAFYYPAVNGNLSILNSAKQRAGPQLKSFVLTSSNASIADSEYSQAFVSRRLKLRDRTRASKLSREISLFLRHV
jgi:nucleoside-diphosphate-sugar epimerase